MSIASQLADIRDHMEQGRSLTAMKALRLFGCMRLSARIHDLKEEGMNIVSRRVKYDGKSFASYSLEGGAK